MAAVKRTSGAGAVVSGTGDAGRRSRGVSTTTYFGLNIFTGLGTGPILLFRCIWCTHASDAANVFCSGGSFQSTGRSLVFET